MHPAYACVQVYAQMEPPAEMLMCLLPFQKEFLAWAVSQERSEIRGGILADEMGMGKTIQVLVTFCSSHTPQLVSNTSKGTLPFSSSLMVGAAASQYKEEPSRHFLVMWSPALPLQQPDSAGKRPELVVPRATAVSPVVFSC